MKEKIILNYRFLDWVTLTIKDEIESTIEELPEEMKTFISVNNMLNEIGDLSTQDISKYVSEPLMDQVFKEIKDSI